MVGSVYGDTNKPDKSKYGQPESMYKTAPPRGCMRDVLNVDVFVKDGEDTHGTVTYMEVNHYIFGKGLYILPIQNQDYIWQ